MALLQWLLSAAAILTAVAALVRTRGAARRLERLTESYWELRYEHGQLRARLAKLEPPDGAADTPASAPAGRGGAAQFVPLSSLKSTHRP